MEYNQSLCDAECTRILSLVQNHKQFRTGVVFSSRMNNYFFDSGTGKILQLGDVEYRLFKAIFCLEATPEFVQAAMNREDKSETNRFLYYSRQMQLMRMPETGNLKFGLHKKISDQIDNNLSQLILEVTQRCNFRCTYCIYNSTFKGNHDFTSSDMTWETAKASLDYLIAHSKNNKNIYVTFYGGEPLLKFDLIKQCVDYIQKKVVNQNLYYNLTTNLSLMTQDMADYFASIPGFTLTVSLDGPEEHDSCRQYANGKPAFLDSMRGMKYVCDSFSAADKQVLISSVLTPPFDFEKLDSINSFFENIPNLPPDSSVTITYPSAGTYDTEDYITKNYNNPRYWEFGEFNPLGKWQLTQAIRNSLSWERSNNLYLRGLVESMMRIKNRFASDTPALRTNCIEGCCVPGARKLYVHPDGEFSICEKIGTSPSIGNLDTGVDKERVFKYYFDDYLKKSEELCANCWAFNICPMCYSLCFGKDGVDIQKKADACEQCRTRTYVALSTFCTIQEERPEAMETFNRTTIFETTS